MGFLIKFVAKTILNGLGLYLSALYVPGFVMTGGIQTIAIGALVLAILNAFVRPILRLISTPLVWITFGLFNFVINMVILWVADQMLTQLAIADLKALFLSSLIIAVFNAFF